MQNNQMAGYYNTTQIGAAQAGAQMNMMMYGQAPLQQVMQQGSSGQTSNVSGAQASMPAASHPTGMDPSGASLQAMMQQQMMANMPSMQAQLQMPVEQQMAYIQQLAAQQFQQMPQALAQIFQQQPQMPQTPQPFGTMMSPYQLMDQQQQQQQQYSPFYAHHNPNGNFFANMMY
jgi:hypothetical protein